jgi:hypothetical protein
MSAVHSTTPDQPSKPEPLLTTKDAARFLSVSEAFLERDRWAGARIPFVRIGTRAVRYKLSELEAYINGQMRMSTSDRGVGQ